MIERLDPIYADFTISQNNLGQVQKEMRAGTLTTEVRLPDSSDEPVIGQLTFLDVAVQDTTGQVGLRATIPNAGHRFWPGRFVNIRLILSTIHQAVLVPATAPQMSAKGTFVYVVKPDSTAEQRPVTFGQRQGDLIVIEQGVRAGERCRHRRPTRRHAGRQSPDRGAAKLSQSRSHERQLMSCN